MGILKAGGSYILMDPIFSDYAKLIIKEVDFDIVDEDEDKIVKKYIGAHHG